MFANSSVLRRFALTHFLLECQFWFPVWMLYLSHRGFSLGTMVLADAVFRLALVSLEFPLGVLSDRIGRRTSYLAVTLLAAATYAGILLVHDLGTLLVVWIVWGAYWAFASGTASAYCYELTVREEMKPQALRVLGWMRAIASLAALLSHLAAGLLFAVRPEWPFVVSLIFSVAAVAIAFTLPETRGKQVAAERESQIKSLLSLPRKNASLYAGVVLLSLALVFFWSPRILMQPMLMELGASAALVSLVYFSYSLAGILAGWGAPRINDRLGARRSVLSGVVLIWIGVVLAGLTPGIAALMFLPLLSFGYYLVHTLLEYLLHSRLEDRHRASMLSAVSFIGGVCILLTRPGLGLIADWRNPQTAFLVWAAAGLAVLATRHLLAEDKTADCLTGIGGKAHAIWADCRRQIALERLNRE